MIAFCILPRICASFFRQSARELEVAAFALIKSRLRRNFAGTKCTWFSVETLSILVEFDWLLGQLMNGFGGFVYSVADWLLAIASRRNRDSN